MNNDTRSIKEHTANIVVALAVMLAILSTAENGIEQRIRIRRRARHLGHGLHAPCICASSSAEIRLLDVVVAAIR